MEAKKVLPVSQEIIELIKKIVDKGALRVQVITPEGTIDIMVNPSLEEEKVHGTKYIN